MNTLLRLIIYANLVPFLAVIFLIILVCINPVFDKKQSKLFLLTGIINAVMLISVSANYILTNSGKEELWMWRSFTTFLNFAVSPVIPLLLYKIFNKKTSSRILYLPLVLNLILCIASMFNGIIFKVNSHNQYGRGILFIIPFMTTVFYLSIILFKPNRSRLTSKRIERLFLLGIIGTLALMMVFEIVYRFNFLTWDVACMGTVMYYLLLNIHQSSVDPLTGAYNRHSYAKMLEKLDADRSGIIALADINNFKDVNDQYGHDAGDRYLIRFVELLNRCFSGMASLYRIGGDEFVLIARKESLERFEETLAKARKILGNEQMEFACGYIECARDTPVSESLTEADRLMYEEKKKMKEK